MALQPPVMVLLENDVQGASPTPTSTSTRRTRRRGAGDRPAARHAGLAAAVRADAPERLHRDELQTRPAGRSRWWRRCRPATSSAISTEKTTLGGGVLHAAMPRGGMREPCAAPRTCRCPRRCRCGRGCPRRPRRWPRRRPRRRATSEKRPMPPAGSDAARARPRRREARSPTSPSACCIVAPQRRRLRPRVRPCAAAEPQAERPRRLRRDALLERRHPHRQQR